MAGSGGSDGVFSLLNIMIVVPLSHREALTWTIKQMMPDTFKGYLLESI